MCQMHLHSFNMRLESTFSRPAESSVTRMKEQFTMKQDDVLAKLIQFSRKQDEMAYK